ncbi:MAG: glycosyltransferase family 4 protein [Acidimicrobiales bacterium]
MSDGPLEVSLVVQQLRRRVPGGIGTYSAALIGALASAASSDPALSVELYASAPPRPGLPDPLAAYGVPVRASRLPGPLLTRFWDVGIGSVSPRGIVHATSMAVPPRRGAPLTAMVHDLAWRMFPDAFPRRGRHWHEAALRRVLQRSAAVFVPSAPVAAQLAEAGAASGSVHVIPHGADHLPPPDHEAASRVLSGAGAGAGASAQRASRDGTFILTVGTIEPRKNLRRVVAAYQGAVTAMDEPMSLVVVGPHGWGPDDDAGASSRGGPGTVLFAGAVEPAVLSALYCQAHLLVYAPLWEGFGLPPIEAMAAGCPVISSAVPSADDGGACVVDPTDVENIADAIVKIANDDEARSRLRSEGLRRAASSTWADSAAAHVSLWRSLA